MFWIKDIIIDKFIVLIFTSKPSSIHIAAQIISNSMTEYVQKYVQKMTVNVQKYDRVCLKV